MTGRDVEVAVAATNTVYTAEAGILAVGSLASVHERIGIRPTDETLDQSRLRRFPHPLKNRLDEKLREDYEETPGQTIYVEFVEDDPRNPINFSYARKWLITLTASCFSIMTASSSAAYALGFPSMTHDLNATRAQATIGLAVYTLGFALVPLVTTSFSEEFGRQPIYIVSSTLCLLFHILIALAQNIQTVTIGRLLAGAAASTSSAMVGGTIADIWAPHERGVPMSVFAILVLSGPGIGCIAAGWIEQNPHLQWRWIQWIHVIWTGLIIVAILTCMKETRPGVLLTRLAEKLRKQTGNHRLRARVEDESPGLRTLIYISCTRPIYLLFTEPVVASFSLWAGFAWGILYALIESIGPAFRDIHGFTTGQTGTVFAAMIVGCVSGEAIQIYQERLYAKYHPTKGPEARLYGACIAAVLFPAGMFIYAWCTYPSVPWIGMAMGVFVIMTGVFIIYVAVFTYLADCYGVFASSALAGQSLTRNLMGTVFPLFTEQMFDRLTYHWGVTLFACIGVLMIPLPYILLWKGPTIRARSKFALEAMHVQ